MKTKIFSARTRDFYHAQLDTLLRVEEVDGQVVVRATSNRFSPGRKTAFVRWLAAEGYISEAHQWSSIAGADALLGVRWVKDLSWVKPDPAIKARTDRFMLCLFAGAVLVWTIMMAIVLS
ncbi:MAG TPA: hypothetical protein VHC95_09730 [Opitutales bacterium]|nr:hypothetical protein [Opitutales bacterium]